MAVPPLMITQPDPSLLRAHYEIQQTALNEIAELIALHDMRSQSTPEDLLKLVQTIDDVAAYARRIDLFNPHNRPGDEEFIRRYKREFDIASQVTK